MTKQSLNFGNITSWDILKPQTPHFKKVAIHFVVADIQSFQLGNSKVLFFAFFIPGSKKLDYNDFYQFRYIIVQSELDEIHFIRSFFNQLLDLRFKLKTRFHVYIPSFEHSYFKPFDNNIFTKVVVSLMNDQKPWKFHFHLQKEDPRFFTHFTASCSYNNKSYKMTFRGFSEAFFHSLTEPCFDQSFNDFFKTDLASIENDKINGDFTALQKNMQNYLSTFYYRVNAILLFLHSNFPEHQFVDDHGLIGFILNFFLKTEYYQKTIGQFFFASPNHLHADTFIRNAYTGGLLAVIKPLLVGKAYFYDVNSMYPFVMQNMPMPTGHPTYIDHVTDLKQFFGFVYAKVSCPQSIKIPILSTRLNSNNRIFPSGSFDGVFFSPELQYAQQIGYQVQLGPGLQFQPEIMFHDTITKLYNLRLQYPKGHFAEQITKFFLNVLSGVFAASIFNRFQYFIWSHSQLTMQSWIEQFLYRRQFIHFNPQSLTMHFDNDNNQQNNLDNNMNYNRNHIWYNLAMFKNNKPSEIYNLLDFQLIDKKTADAKINAFYAALHNTAPQVSAAITSYARIHLHKVIQPIQDHVYYIDTDAIVTDTPLKSSIVHPSRLGSFKLQYTFHYAIFLAPKIYCCINFLTNFKLISFAGIQHRFASMISFQEFLQFFRNKTATLFGKTFHFFDQDPRPSRKFIFDNHLCVDSQSISINQFNQHTHTINSKLQEQSSSTLDTYNLYSHSISDQTINSPNPLKAIIQDQTPYINKDIENTNLHLQSNEDEIIDKICSLSAFAHYDSDSSSIHDTYVQMKRRKKDEGIPIPRDFIPGQTDTLTDNPVDTSDPQDSTSTNNDNQIDKDPPKPKKTRKKKDQDTIINPNLDQDSPKPKRTRKKKDQDPETITDPNTITIVNPSNQQESDPPKPKRTRKKKDQDAIINPDQPTIINPNNQQDPEFPKPKRTSNKKDQETIRNPSTVTHQDILEPKPKKTRNKIDQDKLTPKPDTIGHINQTSIDEQKQDTIIPSDTSIKPKKTRKKNTDTNIDKANTPSKTSKNTTINNESTTNSITDHTSSTPKTKTTRKKKSDD